MDQTDKRRIKTIIIPQGAFDVNDTIVLKVPRCPSSSRYTEKRARSLRRSHSPPKQQIRESYFYDDPPLPASINHRLEKAYYQGFHEGQRLVSTAPEDFNTRDAFLDTLNYPQGINQAGEHKVRTIRNKHQGHYYSGLRHNTIQNDAQRKTDDQLHPSYIPGPVEGGFDPLLAERYKRAVLRQDFDKTDELSYSGYPDEHMCDEYNQFYPESQESWISGEHQ